MPANIERCLAESTKLRTQPSNYATCAVLNAVHDPERDTRHLETSPSRIQGTNDAISRPRSHALNGVNENRWDGQPSGKTERTKPLGSKIDGVLRGCIIRSVPPDQGRNVTNEAMSPSSLDRQGFWGSKIGGRRSRKVSERSHASRVPHLSPASSHPHDGVKTLVIRKSNERTQASPHCPQTAILVRHRACIGKTFGWKPDERSHSFGSMGASGHGIMGRVDRLTSKHDSRSPALWHPPRPEPIEPEQPGACPLSVQTPRSCAWSRAWGHFRAPTWRKDGSVPVMAPLTPPSTFSRGFDRRPGNGADEEMTSLRNILEIGIEIALQVWDPIMSNGRDPGNLATSQASQVTPGPWSPTLERANPLHRDDGRP
jgi:hypothetical protein